MAESVPLADIETLHCMSIFYGTEIFLTEAQHLNCDHLLLFFHHSLVQSSSKPVMSTQFEDVFDNDKGWDGTLIVNAHLEAKDDAAADQVEEACKLIRTSALSDAEPGCTLFRIARAGRLFSIFEKYSGVDAVKHHLSTEVFKAVNAKGEELLAKPPSILFYREVD
ncbi:hypothetical protein FRC02_008998 [Tulasnella sp. 418]|nr:hypothetical protein FRC02_008998 [Tulasnella sp. 418]